MLSVKALRPRSRSFPSFNILEQGGSRISEMPTTSDVGLREAKTHSHSGLLSPFSPVFDLELDSKKVHSSQGMERCFSEQAFTAEGANARPTLFQQIMQLCRCTSPMAAQLLQQLQQLRIAFAANSKRRSSTPPARTGSGSPTTVAAGHLATESSIDIEAMACELLAAGYLVQVRDGAQQQERGKNARSCLHNLRHRFIVCLGWRSSGEAEPEYLPEPLVVEPRFRDQFVIAHPTAEYEALVQAVPPCFVGSAANLEAVVKLLCDQMVAAFKIQGLPVPPWRTRQALLSKWSPAALADLAAKIANVRRASIDMSSGHTHGRLCNGERPAAVHAAHAAVGSAPQPASEGVVTAAAAAYAAACAAGSQQQLTAQQLMSIIPMDMQQLLHQAASGWSAATPAISSALFTGSQATASSSCYAPAAASRNRAVSMTAVAGAAQQAVPTVVPAIPVGPSAPGPAGVVGAAAVQCAPGVSPAAADVLALLGAAEGLTGSSMGSSSTLKFTRKASAEFKNLQRSSNGRKGLLAAALKKKSVAGSSRSNLSSATSSAAGAAGVTESLAAAGLSMGGSSSSAACSGPAQPAVREAEGSDALIRRTHYRASGDQPWARITTVRWGAALPPQAQAPQQQQ